ncbi:hypothetical protein OCGS_0849 [Oceaniovalibus guishaninsula JLT2003]|uniref:DUF5337 domain-containing protein n=1 Tax=Oceaniovalibus guishaninsula JLT2003 TaxID=1231392 RepID=K2HQZ9_9RHOB|nr:DUF5337 domain-containing protein [Oceaniovalibus guishaninsula]EKE45154.1 hypothetical protein OCGS_0849 [Oceaniovalibus guishaninsula JLT2003]
MNDDLAQARRARTIGFVMAGTIVAWFGLQFLAARLNWPVRLMGLIDLVVLAVFVWGLIGTWQLWRARRDRDE